MLTPRSFDHIYIYRPYIDFRCGINGLSILVQDRLEADLFDKNIFIFCNKHRNALKALYWDNTGFCLWHKRLESDKYRWPFHLEQEHLIINVLDLKQFLKGLNPWQIPHSSRDYKII